MSEGLEKGLEVLRAEMDSKVKSFFSSCVNCGICAEACLFYTETQDPRYTPIYKTQPLRKQITQLEKQMEKLNAQLAEVEEKLADSAIYDQSRKAEMNECLQTQVKVKSALEECEMEWLDAQEQLEQMLQGD